ncbi:MAG TPA: hypothetical protein VJT49_04050 [Amycolatopsis sp.]|uniref:hypothetical protein n=1 Tax=Amycolatopsis sp. TaxID=37632 RepID=UPI002B483778|nr:hypothetical protein [Amycolatopsis sp.]HKS44283.1 hypothetical protein [Amycolatopsis sp.]
MNLPFTYNPILDSRSLPRFRMLAPLRPPEPHIALVLDRHVDGMITIRHGEPIPNARHGIYRHMYLIDVAEHRLVLDIPLLSEDPNFAFRSRVGLRCQVIEPADIVRREITDMSGSLYDPLKWMLRSVAKDFDISRFHDAQTALNDEVRHFAGDTAIRLRNIHVELLVDEDEIVTSGRSFRNAGRESRLADLGRNHHLEVLRRDGPEALVAAIAEREGPRAALEVISSIDAAERKELLAAYDAVLKRSDPDREPFDSVEAERFLLNRLAGGSTAPFGGVRSSRVRGSVVAGELGAGGGERDRAGSRTEGYRSPTRDAAEPAVRFADAPPDDEPTGGTPSGGSTPRVSRVRGARP